MRVIIFANGGFTEPPELYPDDLIIAADGGARHCRSLGLTPHLVVGDFDSLDETELAELQAAGSQVVRYARNKDFTDLELALQHARQRGATEILVLAALGGRWDQTLANLLLPAAEELCCTKIRLIDGAQEMSFLRGGECMEVLGQPGDTVSLVPLKGDAHGVTTQGLSYPLHAESLIFGSTRGISNELLGTQASIWLEQGLVLCVVIHITA